MNYTNYTINKKVGIYKKLPKYISKLRYINPDTENEIKKNIIDLKKDLNMVTKKKPGNTLRRDEWTRDMSHIIKTKRRLLKYLRTHKNLKNFDWYA